MSKPCRMSSAYRCRLPAFVSSRARREGRKPEKLIAQDIQVHTRRGHRSRCVCLRSTPDDSSAGLQEMPIFPLGMVALPNADVPLNIFEARYRVLFHTLLDGEEGVEKDLVQEDSPFKGSKRLGMCYTSKEGLSAYGTVLEIVQHKVMPDGRLLVLCKGRERFTLKNIVQEKPVLLCKVQMLNDEEDEGDLEELAEEAKAMFRDLLRLNAKYKKIAIDDSMQNPPELTELKPSQLPFWMVSMFTSATETQQHLLQTESARSRYEFINKSLDETIKRLSAALALESVFKPSEGAVEAEDVATKSVDEKPGDTKQRGPD